MPRHNRSRNFYYLLVFPQMVRLYKTLRDLKQDNFYQTSNFMKARSQTELYILLEKYEPAWYEKYVSCPTGWQCVETYDDGLDHELLYAEYSRKAPIQIVDKE